MANTPTFNYTNKDFLGIRSEILGYAKTFFGDDFTILLNDSSVGSMLVDLLAATGDILSFQADKNFNETQLSYAKEGKNIYELAKNRGLNLPNKRASVTLVELSVTVPTLGSSFDESYCPTLRAGSQFIGGGKSFELLDDVSFANPNSNLSNTPNRKIIPNIDSNSNIISYTISKIEPVYNGITKTYRQVIRAKDSKPFYSFYLPDDDILEIESIIVKTGEVETASYDDYYDENLKYFEVPYLAEPYIFTEDLSGVEENNLKVAKLLRVDKKFIKEFSPNGFCKITFGGGNGDLSNFDDAVSAKGFNSLQSYLSSTALGRIIPANSTLFIKYRVGGGANTNIGANVITSLGNIFFSINGTRDDYNQQIRKSLKVNNIIPAFGGADRLSIEQVRYLAAYNNASQGRCVTLTDYLVKTYLIEGRYGSPFKVNVFKEDNKVLVMVLGLDSLGKLNNSSISLLKKNISLWLSQFRMVNDYVEVRDAKIINLSYNVTVLAENNISNASLASQVINAIYEFHNIQKNNMGDQLFLGSLIETINNVSGVLNILEMKIFNKVAGNYSINEINMSYVDDLTREIDISDYTLYTDNDSMFEIKYPENDINITIKKKNDFTNRGR